MSDQGPGGPPRGFAGGTPWSQPPGSMPPNVPQPGVGGQWPIIPRPEPPKRSARGLVAVVVVLLLVGGVVGFLGWRAVQGPDGVSAGAALGTTTSGGVATTTSIADPAREAFCARESDVRSAMQLLDRAADSTTWQPAVALAKQALPMVEDLPAIAPPTIADQVDRIVAFADLYATVVEAATKGGGSWEGHSLGVNPREAFETQLAADGPRSQTPEGKAILAYLDTCG